MHVQLVDDLKVHIQFTDGWTVYIQLSDNWTVHIQSSDGWTAHVQTVQVFSLCIVSTMTTIYFTPPAHLQTQSCKICAFCWTILSDQVMLLDSFKLF